MAAYDGGGIAAGRVGIGANFAKSRMMLAKRAGYLPQGYKMQPDQAPEQWKSVSSNLARDARSAGFQHPLQYLRQGATQGGQIPKATRMRPGAQADPSGALAYANSRIAALQAQGRPQLPRLPNLPPVGQPMGQQQMSPQIMQMLMQRMAPRGRM
jgi:hypothetical protein